MALAAACGDVHLLAVRQIGCQRNTPIGGLSHFGKRREIGRKPGNLGIAQLFLREGGHDAPGLAHSMLKFRSGQAPAGQIGTKAALAVA